MTKRFLTYSMLIAAVMTGCTDEFQSYEAGNTGIVNGVKGKLVKAGLLGGGSEQEMSSTRAFNKDGQFVWMPEELDENGAILNNSNQKIGLCWTGVNEINSNYGAVEKAGVNVYTNYEYEHVGWIANSKTTLEFDECDGELLNGAYIVDKGNPEALFNGSWKSEDAPWNRTNKYYYGATTGKYTDKTGKEQDLNLGGGIFETKNASVFEGQYIVYFPYTNKFTKGAIVANEPDNFVVDAGYDKYATASKYAFQVGYINNYQGGQSSQNFSAGNYASFATIRLTNSTGRTWSGNIKTVILYSGSKILYEYGIDASSVITARNTTIIKNGVEKKDMTKVQRADDKSVMKSTNAIYAYVKNTKEKTSYETVSLSDVTAHTRDLLTLPVLPQDVESLSVILVNDEDKTMKFELGTQNFAADNATILACNTDNKDWDNIYYVVDEPSFASAMEKIYTKGNPKGKNVINILRPINLEEVNDNCYTTEPGTISYNKKVEINADPSVKDAALIVKGDTYRFINSTGGGKLTVNVPVIVEGAGCCATNAAVLKIGTDENADKVIFNKTVTNYGTTIVGPLNISGAATYTYNVQFADFKNIWDIEYMQAMGYSKNSLTRPNVEGAAKLMISNTLDEKSEVKMTGKLTNEGQVLISSCKELSKPETNQNVRSLDVKIGSIENKGILANNVDAKKAALEDIVGGQILITENALVTVNENIQNINENSYIHVEGQGKSNTTDGRLDVKGAGTSMNKGTIENDGVINLLNGSLNNTEGLFIDNLTGQVGGIAVNNGAKPEDYKVLYYKGIRNGEEYRPYQTDLNNGIYVSKANTNQRLGFIVTDAVESKSCNIIEITDVAQDNQSNSDAYDLALDDYKRLDTGDAKDLAGFDVRIAEGIKSVVNIVCDTKNNDNKYNAIKCIGNCMDVYSNVNIGKADKLNIQQNLFVRKGKTITMSKTVSMVEVGGTIDVEKDATLTANAVGTECITKSSKYVQANKLVNNGTVITYKERDLKITTDVENGNKENKAASLTTNDLLEVGKNIENWAAIATNDQFTVGQDFNINKGASLASKGNNNIVNGNFNLYGKSEFEAKTTTTINNTFNGYSDCMFIRKGIGNGSQYRATVNVKKLGKTDGTTVGGWPTQM